MASVQVPAPGSQGYTLAEVAWVLSLLENVGHHDHHVRSGTDRSLLDLMTHRPDNAVQIFIHLVDNKQLQVHIRQLCLVLLSQLVQRLHPDFCRWEGLSSHSQQFVTEFAFKQSCESKEKLMRKASVSGIFCQRFAFSLFFIPLSKFKHSQICVINYFYLFRDDHNH